MLGITAVLVVGQFVLLAAFVLGIVAFVGLVIYDLYAGRETEPQPAAEQTAYAPTPARAA